MLLVNIIIFIIQKCVTIYFSLLYSTSQTATKMVRRLRSLDPALYELKELQTSAMRSWARMSVKGSVANGNLCHNPVRRTRELSIVLLIQSAHSYVLLTGIRTTYIVEKSRQVEAVYEANEMDSMKPFVCASTPASHRLNQKSVARIVFNVHHRRLLVR